MVGRSSSTSKDDVLAIFEDNADKCEPFTAPQIAEQLQSDIHRNTARNYLQDLEALGELRTKKVGPGRVWWQPCNNILQRDR